MISKINEWRILDGEKVMNSEFADIMECGTALRMPTILSKNFADEYGGAFSHAGRHYELWTSAGRRGMFDVTDPIYTPPR